MYPEVFSANKEVRYYYLSLFGQLFMIFFAFNSILFEDASPARVRILAINLVFFMLLSVYTVKKIVEMVQDIPCPSLI